jgi:hypothetical protein
MLCKSFVLVRQRTAEHWPVAISEANLEELDMCEVYVVVRLSEIEGDWKTCRFVNG